MSIEDDVIALHATYREARAAAAEADRQVADLHAAATRAHDALQAKTSEWRAQQIVEAARSMSDLA